MLNIDLSYSWSWFSNHFANWKFITMKAFILLIVAVVCATFVVSEVNFVKFLSFRSIFLGRIHICYGQLWSFCSQFVRKHVVFNILNSLKFKFATWFYKKTIYFSFATCFLLNEGRRFNPSSRQIPSRIGISRNWWFIGRGQLQIERKNDARIQTGKIVNPF